MPRGRATSTPASGWWRCFLPAININIIESIVISKQISISVLKTVAVIATDADFDSARGLRIATTAVTGQVGGDLKAEDFLGRTPLHMAARKGFAAAVKVPSVPPLAPPPPRPAPPRPQPPLRPFARPPSRPPHPPNHARSVRCACPAPVGMCAFTRTRARARVHTHTHTGPGAAGIGSEPP